MNSQEVADFLGAEHHGDLVELVGVGPLEEAGPGELAFAEDKVSGEAGVVIFRRKGEKAYKRRLSASKDLLRRSELDTLHPAFTRDVANNVWHMRNGRGLNHVIDRLGSLLAWPDERILISDMTTIRARSRKKPAYDKDLIGRPTKYPYAGTSNMTDRPLD